MLALFCGTASLPHILIRYYTVKDEAAARKSTVVGIACIGFFYVLTLYLGLGAMTSGALDVTEHEHGRPAAGQELQRAAVRDHLGDRLHHRARHGQRPDPRRQRRGRARPADERPAASNSTDHGKVRAGKIAAVVVGVIAIVLGILFEKLNVSFLVGWAFNVAASANLPALVMLLFWKRHDQAGHHRRDPRRHGLLARPGSC